MKYFGTFILYLTLRSLWAQETDLSARFNKDRFPINISQNPGYDNYRLWDNDHLLYTEPVQDKQISFATTSTAKPNGYATHPRAVNILLYAFQKVKFSAILSRHYWFTTPFAILLMENELLFSPLKIGYQRWRFLVTTLLCTVLVEDHMNLMLVQSDSATKLITEKGQPPSHP